MQIATKGPKAATSPENAAPPSSEEKQADNHHGSEEPERVPSEPLVQECVENVASLCTVLTGEGADTGHFIPLTAKTITSIANSPSATQSHPP